MASNFSSGGKPFVVLSEESSISSRSDFVSALSCEASMNCFARSLRCWLIAEMAICKIPLF